MAEPKRKYVRKPKRLTRSQGKFTKPTFVRAARSSIAQTQDVVQRVGNAIIGGDFTGNARGEYAVDIQIERSLDDDPTSDAQLVASGNSSLAFGRFSKASGESAIAIGNQSTATGASSAAIGNASALGDGSVALGVAVAATQNYGVAVGYGTQSTALGAVAVGQSSLASGLESLAVGAGAQVPGAYAYATAVGRGAAASAARAVAIGSLAQAANADEVVIAGTSIYLQTAAATYKKIWHENNDGAGSTLDADLLDGLDSTAFVLASALFNNAEGDPANAGATASDGTSAYAARRDHVHDVTWANGYTTYDARYALAAHAHAATYAPIGSAFVTIGTDATLTGERALTGAANQITVTDNGAGSTVVLSTPQNIHTAATPQFAQMGIGIAAQSGTTQYVYASKADQSWNGQVVNSILYNTSDAGANVLKAMYFQALFGSSATYVGHNTANPGVIAIQGVAGLASGSSKNLTGAQICDLYIQNAGSGTLTNGIAIYIRNPTNSGGGAITNAVGAMIAKHTTATNQTQILSGTTTIPSGNYGIYEVSGYTNYFAGDVQIADKNLIFGTGTGTKVATATDQKIGFWNATPIIQPTTGVAAATFTANAGTAVNDASTFDGYTLKQVVKALRNMGLLA